MTNFFKEQIKEDIDLLKENLSWDSRTKKDEFAFNYWVLSNLYSLDEESCNANITENNDKGIDCFVDYEDDKELYIIQNKYYDDSTRLSSKEVSDFLNRPLATLKKGTYTRSPELQKIYSLAKNDDKYKIFLHFYVSNDKSNDDIKVVVNDFKERNKNSFVFAEIFFLEDIKEKYFGTSFSKNPKELKTQLKVKNKGTYLAIRPEEYNLPQMSEAYYVMGKITDVFNLWKLAKEKKYPLFEQNIREYLGGTSGINNAIIETLRDPEKRANFFYYNNGITIICDSAKADSKEVNIVNPQIVNGCQTVNSIAEVLKSIENPQKDFEDVYVMVKILILELKEKDNSFYRDIVKYTNSQNSINEKVFGATLQPFFTIQNKLKNYGILLRVKQSDKFQFKETYKDKKSSGLLIKKAKKFSEENFFAFEKLADLQIPLETLIQIIGSYLKDAHFAYTKKSYLLRQTRGEYQDFSTKIGEKLTTKSMAKLVLLYKKAEKDKKESKDKRSPSPYYLLNFIGYYLHENEIDLQIFLKKITISDLNFVYDKFKKLSSKYIKECNEKYKLEYNQIIKQKVDLELMKSVLNGHIKSLKEYNEDEFKKLNKIFEKINNVS